MRNIRFLILTLFFLTLLGACSSGSDPAPVVDGTTGDTTGDTTGGTTGDTTGSTTGDTSGSTTGDTSGSTTADTTGGTTGDTTGSTAGDTTGSTTGDTSGDSQASVECSTTINGGITTRAAASCNEIVFGIFLSELSKQETVTNIIAARVSDPLIGTINNLTAAYQSLNEPFCQWVEAEVDEFVPVVDRGEFDTAFQNLQTLTKGQNLVFSNNGNSVGELPLTSQATETFTFNGYFGNLILPPGQNIRLTSTGGDIPLKSVDFESAPVLEWPSRIDSADKVSGPYTWSTNYSGTPLANVVARLVHFNFDVTEAGDDGRTFNYDCSIVNPGGAGSHVPELLDGLNLDGATVSGFQASVEHITVQVLDGVFVFLVSSYLI